MTASTPFGQRQFDPPAGVPENEATTEIFVVIEWVKGSAIIDGAEGFYSRAALLAYLDTLPTNVVVQERTGIEVNKTICRVNLHHNPTNE